MVNAPACPLRWEEMHYRLVSLWDLFVHRLDTRKFIDGFQVLAKMAQLIQARMSNPQIKEMGLPSEGFEYIGKSMASLLEEAQNLDLDVAAANLEKAIRVWSDGRTPENRISAEAARNFLRLIEMVQTAIYDQLAKQTVLVIPLSKVKLYDPPAPLFGDDVFRSFASANDDIAEAGKCLALNRGTACVMHLNRAQEVALKALAKAAGVGQQSDWGAYIREIEKELRARLASAGKRTADEQFYSEAVTEFDHVRRAWRNPTMHPEKSYSTERAEEIFAAVRSFMRHLATRISE